MLVAAECQDLFDGIILSSAGLAVDPQSGGTLIVRVFPVACISNSCMLFSLTIEGCCQSPLVGGSKIWIEGSG